MLFELSSGFQNLQNEEYPDEKFFPENQMKYSKGQISPLLMWALGLIATVALGLNGLTANTNNNQDKTILNHEGRIASTETEIKRIPIIEGKLDRLLDKQGLDSSAIGREIQRQKENLRKKIHKLHRSINRENIRQTRSIAEGKKQTRDRSMSRGERGYFTDRASDVAGKNTKKLQTLLEEIHENLAQMRTSKRKSLRVSLTTESKKKNIYSLDSCSLYINNLCLIKNIKIDQSVGDRYVIFGKNGSGKSSFAKALLSIEPYRFEPKAKINNSAKIVYFDQQYSAINPEKTVLENMQVYSNMFIDDIRKHLSRYLFFTQQDVNQKAKHLSGGMLARLACAIITISPIDLLILDEPTNNLDIETIQELILALSEYKGALLVISHDIDFVKKIEPNKLLFIKNNILKNLSTDDLSEIKDISNLL